LDTDKNIQRQVGEQSKENLKANQRKDWKKNLPEARKTVKSEVHKNFMITAEWIDCFGDKMTASRAGVLGTVHSGSRTAAD
jgi:hypothetical protein